MLQTRKHKSKNMLEKKIDSDSQNFHQDPKLEEVVLQQTPLDSQENVKLKNDIFFGLLRLKTKYRMQLPNCLIQSRTWHCIICMIDICNLTLLVVSKCKKLLVEFQ
jgi:hypothetical protein